LSVCLSVCLCVCLSVCLQFVCLFVCLSSVSICIQSLFSVSAHISIKVSYSQRLHSLLCHCSLCFNSTYTHSGTVIDPQTHIYTIGSLLIQPDWKYTNDRTCMYKYKCVYVRTRTCSSGSACIFLSAELATMSLTSSCSLEKASPNSKEVDIRWRLREYYRNITGILWMS
jgi:hypothetical protein